MRILLALTALAALAGCQSVEQLRAVAPQQPDIAICRAMVVGNANLRQVAWEEQQRRGLDCNPHLPMIQAQQQNDAARAAIGLQMMQANRPQPVYMQPLPTPAQPVYCNSQQIGNQIHTNCR